MNLLRYHMFGSSCALLLAFGMLSACSQQDDVAAQATAAARVKAATEAKARRMAEQLDLYRKQVQAGDDAAADSTGRDIVQLYADSDAAKEVQQTLPAIQGRMRELAAKARLAALWSYQVAPMMGGTQSTASILSNQRVGGNQVQLVLRRHTQWGLSVFLYGGRFVCKGTCTLPATFDDKPHPIRGFLPPTGEPSIMIQDEKDFITALSRAKKIVIPVVLKDSGKSRDLTYDVGGYDASKWAPLPGAKKKG